MPIGTSYLFFGPARQDVGEKQLADGDLISAVNVRQTSKRGVYQKRRGFDVTTMTFSGGSLSGYAKNVLPGLGGSALGTDALLMRDSGDQVWAQSGTVWNYRGYNPRVYCTSSILESTQYTTPNQAVCLVGSNVWTFGVATNAYHITINSASTGATVQATFSVVAASITRIAAAYDGTYVWAIWVDGTNNHRVYCHKITASTPTVAPTETSWQVKLGYGGGSLPTLQHIKASYLSSVNKVFVAYAGWATTPEYYVGYAAVIPSTGLPADTGQIACENIDATHSDVLGAVCIPPGQTGASGYVYFSYYGMATSAASTAVGNRLVKVTLSDQTCTIASGTTTNRVAGGGVVVYGASMTSAGDKQLMITTLSDNGTLYGTQTIDYFDAGTHDGSTSTAFADYWMASGFSNVGTQWYFLTGFDDIRTSAVPTGTAQIFVSTQRSYHVRMLDAATSVQGTPQIVGHILNGEAAPAFHQVAGTTPSYTNVGDAPMMVVSSAKLITAVGIAATTTSNLGLARITIDTGKTFSAPCQAMGRAFGPGSIPIVWSNGDSMHELSPLLNPVYCYESAAGTGSDFAGIAFVYIITDSDGTVWRSSPYVANATIGHGATWRVATMFHSLPGTTIGIEVYIGTTSTLKLQTVLANTTAAAYVAYTTPTAATMVDGEILYTDGNALSQTWPPQCQTVGYWRNRVFLGQGNILWYSKEIEIGKALIFNEYLRSSWNGYDRDITAICPNGYSTATITGPDGVASIDGPGPDGLGNGAYSIQTLQTSKGLAAGGAAVQGPNGVYFQDAVTYRLVCAMPNGQVMECGGGAYNYAIGNYTIYSGAMVEVERQLWFYAGATTVIVIDFQHATQTEPFGQVYTWTGISTVTGTCANTGPVYLTSTGAVARPGANFRDNGTDYRMSLRLAALKPANLQGEWDCRIVQFLGTYKANCGVQLRAYRDDALIPITANAASITAAPLQLKWQPSGCMRLQTLGIEILESSGTGQAFEFEGIGIEYYAYGRLRNVNTTQLVSGG